MEVWKTRPRSAGGPVAPSRTQLLEPAAQPQGPDVSSPLRGNGRPSSGGLHVEKNIRSFENSQLDSRKRVGERCAQDTSLYPRLLLRRGADVRLALALLEVSSCTGGVCNLVTNNLGFCQGGVWSQGGHPESTLFIWSVWGFFFFFLAESLSPMT